MGDGIRTRDIQIHNLEADQPKPKNSKGLRIAYPLSDPDCIPDETTDLDLIAIIDAWPRLSKSVRDAVTKLVKGTAGKGTAR